MPLSKSEIRKILLGESLAGRGPSWPKKEDRERLYKACVANATKVMFSNGKEYSIKYYHREASLGRSAHDQVYIKPSDGSVAGCGWFDIERLLVD